MPRATDDDGLPPRRIISSLLPLRPTDVRTELEEEPLRPVITRTDELRAEAFSPRVVTELWREEAAVPRPTPPLSCVPRRVEAILS